MGHLGHWSGDSWGLSNHKCLQSIYKWLQQKGNLVTHFCNMETKDCAVNTNSVMIHTFNTGNKMESCLWISRHQTQRVLVAQSVIFPSVWVKSSVNQHDSQACGKNKQKRKWESLCLLFCRPWTLPPAFLVNYRQKHRTYLWGVLVQSKLTVTSQLGTAKRPLKRVRPNGCRHPLLIRWRRHHDLSGISFDSKTPAVLKGKALMPGFMDSRFTQSSLEIGKIWWGWRCVGAGMGGWVKGVQAV